MRGSSVGGLAALEVGVNVQQHGAPVPVQLLCPYQAGAISDGWVTVIPTAPMPSAIMA